MSKETMVVEDKRTKTEIDLQKALAGEVKVFVVQMSRFESRHLQAFVKGTSDPDKKFGGYRHGNYMTESSYLEVQDYASKYKGIEIISFEQYFQNTVDALTQSTGVPEGFCQKGDRQPAIFQVSDSEHGLDGFHVCKGCGGNLEELGFELVSLKKQAQDEILMEFAKAVMAKGDNFDPRPGAKGPVGSKEARGVNLDAKCALTDEPMISEVSKKGFQKWMNKKLAALLGMTVDQLPDFFSGMHFGATWFKKFDDARMSNNLYGGFSQANANSHLHWVANHKQLNRDMGEKLLAITDYSTGESFEEGESRYRLQGEGWDPEFRGVDVRFWFWAKYLAPRGSFPGYESAAKRVTGKEVGQLTRLNRSVTGDGSRGKGAAKIFGKKTKSRQVSQKATEKRRSGGTDKSRKGGRSSR